MRQADRKDKFLWSLENLSVSDPTPEDLARLEAQRRVVRKKRKSRRGREKKRDEGV